jgi:hypothetical protein
MKVFISMVGNAYPSTKLRTGMRSLTPRRPATLSELSDGALSIFESSWYCQDAKSHVMYKKGLKSAIKTTKVS